MTLKEEIILATVKQALAEGWGKDCPEYETRAKLIAGRAVDLARFTLSEMEDFGLLPEGGDA